MTIGIGGWGSRRKPMALVRAILRSPLRTSRSFATAGPDVGLLCASGQARGCVAGFVSLDSIALEPHFRPPGRTGRRAHRVRRGHVHWGLLAAAHRLPFLPTRAGLGSGVLRVNPELRTVRSPYADPYGIGEELVAMPALRAGRRAGPHEPGRRRGQRPVPRPRPVLRRPVLPGGRARVRVVRANRARACSKGRRSLCCSTGPWCTPSRKRRTARTSPAASPTTAATRRSRRTTRGPPPTPRSGNAFRAGTWTGTKPPTRKQCARR